MYVQFDYKGQNFDATNSLPSSAKFLESDVYYDPYKKMFYYYAWGDGDAYRYKYMSRRVKSIDGVQFLYDINSGVLSRIVGKVTCNIFYNEYRIIKKVGDVYIKMDQNGNILKYGRYPGALN